MKGNESEAETEREETWNRREAERWRVREIMAKTLRDRRAEPAAGGEVQTGTVSMAAPGG